MGLEALNQVLKEGDVMKWFDSVRTMLAGVCANRVLCELRNCIWLAG
jgi:hypothetical protein